MTECVFCKIAGKKIDAAIVHETGRLVVIKDIHPQAPTHLLIMPKEHYRSLMECEDAQIMAEMLGAAKDVAKKLGIAERGFRLIMNTNEEGGQTVFHMHMHLMAGRALTGRMG